LYVWGDGCTHCAGAMNLADVASKKAKEAGGDNARGYCPRLLPAATLLVEIVQIEQCFPQIALVV